MVFQLKQQQEYWEKGLLMLEFVQIPRIYTLLQYFLDFSTAGNHLQCLSAALLQTEGQK